MPGGPPGSKCRFAGKLTFGGGPPASKDTGHKAVVSSVRTNVRKIYNLYKRPLSLPRTPQFPRPTSTLRKTTPRYSSYQNSRGLDLECQSGRQSSIQLHLERCAPY